MSPLPLPPQLPTPDQLHIKGQYHMYDTLSAVKHHQPPQGHTCCRLRLEMRCLREKLGVGLRVWPSLTKLQPSIFSLQQHLHNIIMAALLPTILSDDEEEESSSIKGSSGGHAVNKSTKKRKKSPVTDNVSDDDGSTADEMDGDFEFGGLLVRFSFMGCHIYYSHISLALQIHNLSYIYFVYYNYFFLKGEDGNTSFDALSSNISTTSNSWSYKSALSLLSKNDNENRVGAQVERTNVASIIAAARSNLRHGRRNEDDGDGDSGESDDDDDEKKRDVKEEEGSDSSSGSSSGSSSDSSDDNGSDDDDSSGEDEVDDADQATSMESDVLKVRERPVRKKDKMMKKKKAAEEEEVASEKSHSEEEGGDKSSSSSSEDSESGNESGSDDEG